MKKKIQKPFDVQAAKRGARIETKSGRSVRILCYDRAKTSYPIVALVNCEDSEDCCTYTIGGLEFHDGPTAGDLVIVEEVEETKFNVGDWVFMNTHGSQPWLVIKVTPNYYEIKDSFGHVTAKSHHTIDSLFRLWTIKDARPGDVLISENSKRPFIFKVLNGVGYPIAYWGIDIANSIAIDTSRHWTSGPVRPATYEEKEMLFKKMEEEGYKWDAESLTLSKIQKRWRDNENAYVSGYFIDSDSEIEPFSLSGCNTPINYNVFSTNTQAKSALAMARISQIMANDERFGGVITDKEWNNLLCYVILRRHDSLEISTRYGYEFLAFHKYEQAQLFLKENEDLIKDFYMMD